MYAGSVCYDEGESEAESSNMEISNPIFQLYEAVRGARNNQGQLFSEPFQQLPSRREYPDYYQQIKQPISLQQIRSGMFQIQLMTNCVSTFDWFKFVIRSAFARDCFFVLISRAKMKNGEYDSLEQMDADLTLMFENAKRYNMPNSSIYKRAFRLQQIIQVSCFF